MRCLSSTLLPDPDVPMIVSSSPLCTSRSMPSRTHRSPNRFLSPRISESAMSRCASRRGASRQSAHMACFPAWHVAEGPRPGEGPGAGECMAQGDHLELQGVVTDVFAGGNFKIETDQGVEIRARLGGRLRRNR